MIIKQNFNLVLSFNDGQEIKEIDCRKWSNESRNTQGVGKIEDKTQEMGDVGACQIQEIWKYAGHFNMENSKKYGRVLLIKVHIQMKLPIYMSVTTDILRFLQKKKGKIFVRIQKE